MSGSAVGGRTGDIAAARWVSRRGDLRAWDLRGHRSLCREGPLCRAGGLLADYHEESPAIEVQFLEPELEAATTARDGREAPDDYDRIRSYLKIIAV